MKDTTPEAPLTTQEEMMLWWSGLCWEYHPRNCECNDMGEFPSPENQEGRIIVRDLPPKKSNQ
jgi:hypothetical protein